MGKAVKRAAAFLCACLIMVSIFALISITSYADHDCSGEHCEICLEIAHLQHTLKHLSAAILATAFVLSAVCAVGAVVEEGSANRTGTLISLKVQLNN